MQNIFRFKQFEVNQYQCAMKIGTDAVTLGAWTCIDKNPFSILDIGSGTGILALMLAQRSNAEIIDALEIDEQAYEECVENFENSNWNDRLFCYHASLEEFVNEIDTTYDLIICNPPFYSENYKTKNTSRNLARFQEALPFNHLIKSVSQLLHENGSFSVIVPFKEEQNFIEIAKKFKLSAYRILRLKGNSNSEIKRSLMAFSFQKTTLEISNLIIETERHQYTEEYIKLTKEFYLKM